MNYQLLQQKERVIGIKIRAIVSHQETKTLYTTPKGAQSEDLESKIHRNGSSTQKDSSIHNQFDGEELILANETMNKDELHAEK